MNKKSLGWILSVLMMFTFVINAGAEEAKPDAPSDAKPEVKAESKPAISPEDIKNIVNGIRR